VFAAPSGKKSSGHQPIVFDNQLRIKPNIQMYKKNTKLGRKLFTCYHQRIFRVMKLLSIFMLIGIMQVSANSNAQQIDLQLKSASLQQAFLQIQKQSGYDFLYSSQLIKTANPVSAVIKDASIAEALDIILENQPFVYVINKKTITIKAKPQQPKSIKVSGKVSSETNEPLIGVSVRLKNTQTATITDEKGNFTITVPDKNAILVFRYIGFEELELSVGDKKQLLVTMKRSISKLDEVVFIGYGEVKKKDLTGAVSSVNIKDLEGAPVQRIDQMLQGRIAGAEIVSTSGEPGAGTSIRIRGTRSINATNEPLYVVDGVMDAVTSMNDINPEDVESIQVLKDASSTAIYGSRGANGVIMITTKKGKDGKNEFNFKATRGQSALPRYLDLMNAQEFAELQNDRYYFQSTANQIKPLEQYPYPDPASLGEGTNWTKEITEKAPYTDFTFTAAGGNRSTRYYFSANYNDYQGIIINSGAKRTQFRLNLDHTISKNVTAGINLNYAVLDRELNKADIGTQTLWYKSTIFLSPTMPAYKADGSFNDWNTQWYTGTLFDSPLVNAKLLRRDQLTKTLSPMAFLEVSPLKSLKIKSSVSYYDQNRFDDYFSPSTLPTRANRGSGAYAYKRAYRANNVLNENTISFNKTWNRAHKFDALYGFTVQKNWYSNLSASGEGYFIDDNNTNDLGSIPSKETVNLSSSYEDRGRLSHLGRLNYSYLGKYYLTLTGRFDAGSNFAADKKWAFFPSAAFKWNLKEEKFLKNISAVNQLALRLSAGVSGNDAISMYQSLSQLSASTSGYIFDGAIPVAYYPTRIANPDLTWEKTKSVNLGVDATFLKNKIDLSLELYASVTNDLLLSVQLPNQAGYSSRLTNIGETSNKGVELSISTKNITRKKFYWNSSFTIAHNKQMVNDIGGLDRIAAYINPYGGNYMMYGYVAGRPLNALWGMEYAGVWKNQAEITQNNIDKKYASSSTAFYQPGRQRYIDQNKDGILNNDDLVYLGNADPIIYGGLQNSFRFNRFYLNFFFSYSLGGKIYNPTELFMGTGTYLSNQYKYMVNAWHPVRNPNSDIPRADSKDDIPNDRFVYDASFLRLKSLSATYVFDMKKLTTNKLQELKLMLYCNNVFLLKKYNGYDPEVSTESGSSTIRRMDNGAYPASRTISLSAFIKF